MRQHHYFTVALLTVLEVCVEVLTYLLTYLLTPWSTVLLEKLTGSATSPYPEPKPSSPHNPLPLPEDPS